MSSSTHSMNNGPQVLPLYVADRAHASWDWNHQKTNSKFLRGLQPDYFAALARAHQPLLDGPDKQFSAITLRIGASQGKETLFALLCGLLQAPQAIATWMVRYKNQDLKKVVHEVSEWGPTKVRSPWSDSLDDWRDVSGLVHEIAEPIWNDGGATTDAFGDIWSRWASEFVAERYRDEYNSLKHGLRASLGGFTFVMRPGEPESSHPGVCMAHSDFGTTYWTAEQFDKHNVRVLQHDFNWNPVDDAKDLQIISMSINNVIGKLLILNGESPEDVSFVRPDKTEAFTQREGTRGSIYAISHNSIIPVERFSLIRKEDIEIAYSGP